MKNLKLFHIIGTLFTIFLGSFLHFTYDLSNQYPLVGLFSSLDESTLEHLKLLFFPYLFFIIIEYFAYGKYSINFVGAKAVGAFVGLIAIPILFYSYTSILATNYLPVDIIIFIFSVVLAYFVSYVLQKKRVPLSNEIGELFLFVMTFLFFIHSYSLMSMS